MIVGEYFAKIAKCAGKIASELLIHEQWGYKTPDWFDHRHHILDPDKWCKNDWSSSADNILKVLPLHGTMLNLCSGDGFYDYHFFRKKAKEIECVEIGPTVYKHVCRLHSAKNITYNLQNVLTYQSKKSYYDVVIIRGAIEHFSQTNQQIILQKALTALKPNGWFCGDTPANPQKSDHKKLPAHENEWANENEMKRELSKVFNHIETFTIQSVDRLTLFWRCQK